MGDIPSQARRSWLSTREVRALLGGISQQRVSQLRKAGRLLAEKDDEGRLMFDRVIAERESSRRVAVAAKSADELETRQAEQAEARERFARGRKRRAEELERRQTYDDALKERAVKALERIAASMKVRQ